MNAFAVRTARELPESRRANFVWHFCWRAGFSLDTDLDAQPFMRTSCSSYIDRSHPNAPTHALLGTDDLFHLMLDRRIACGGNRLQRRHPRIAAMAAPVSLFDIPREQQCRTERNTWPSGTLVHSDLGLLRSNLIDAFGVGCATCRNPWAAIVDHDHQTGLVRGYLCRDCNRVIDGCPHLAGCRFADYLQQPPAARLSITHPDATRWLKAPKYVARRRCYDIVMSGGVSPGHGTQPLAGLN